MYDPYNVYRGRYKDFIESIMMERPLNEYFEHSSYHHVIPSCCGGIDNDEENLRLYLNHSEHFIAHKILVEENPEHKGLIYAYWRMCNGRITTATPEEYEDARKRVSLIQRTRCISSETKRKISESRKRAGGHPHTEVSKKKLSESWCYDKHFYPEAIKNMSEAAKHRPPITEDHRKKLSECHRIENLSNETRQKLSEGVRLSWDSERRLIQSEKYRGENNPFYGRKHSEETITKMRESCKKRKFHLICKSCGEEFLGNSSNQRYCVNCNQGKNITIV